MGYHTQERKISTACTAKELVLLEAIQNLHSALASRRAAQQAEPKTDYERALYPDKERQARHQVESASKAFTAAVLLVLPGAAVTVGLAEGAPAP
jgi:hypothetical protein